MLIILQEILPIVLMVVLGELAARAALRFFALDRATAFVIMTRVSSWLVAIVLTALIVVRYADLVVVQPREGVNTWMTVFIILTVANLALTSGYALLIASTHVLMAVNYSRVASGRRRAQSLVISAIGAIALAAAAITATTEPAIGLGILAPLGFVHILIAWWMDRHG